MITLPALDDTQKLKLSELHRLTVETHATVIRLEATHSGNAETLKKIEHNTATVAEFFAQLNTVTNIAAGKNQVPMPVFLVLIFFVGLYAIVTVINNSNMDIKVPWLGIEIAAKKDSGGG